MKIKVTLLLFLFILVFAVACKRQPRSTADVPHVLSHSYTVSVANFTQPTTSRELILGRIPENQGLINDEDLRLLDLEFKNILTSRSQRNFIFLKPEVLKTDIAFHNTAQPHGLDYWVAYGQKHGADLLLVPQVLNWHERQGSKAGVTSSAWVRVEFFLIRVKTGQVMSRSFFEEQQEALAENFLKIADFIKRRGSWVTAFDLAREGMQKACKDIGI